MNAIEMWWSEEMQINCRLTKKNSFVKWKLKKVHNQFELKEAHGPHRSPEKTVQINKNI